MVGKNKVFAKVHNSFDTHRIACDVMQSEKEFCSVFILKLWQLIENANRHGANKRGLVLCKEVLLMQAKNRNTGGYA